MAGSNATDKPSRLLSMLDAITKQDIDPNDRFPDISPEFRNLLERFVFDVHDGAEPLSAAEQQQLDTLIANQPRGLLLLRMLLDESRLADSVSPELIERQRSQILGDRTRRPPDFSTCLMQGSLSFAGTPPRRVTRSFNVARSTHEPVTRLQHIQRLAHCEVSVTVEIDGHGRTFTIALRLIHVDARYVDQPQRGVLSSDGTRLIQSLPVTDNEVEFEQLPAGLYTLEVLVHDTLIGLFSADLSTDENA